MGLLDYAPGKTRIKICGLRTPADIEAAIKAKVDAIGLVFFHPAHVLFDQKMPVP